MAPDPAQHDAPPADSGQAHHAHVEVLDGRPTLFVDGEPAFPMLYALTDVPGGRWSWEELPQHNIRQFCQRGVRLVQVGLFFDQIWKEDGSLDLSLARRQLEGVRTACPEALVIIRFHLTAPRWWRDEHPEEWVVYADTDYFDEDFDGSLLRPIAFDNEAVRRVSLASQRYREEATPVFREFLERLSDLPEAANFIGLHIADGVYGEWHYWGFFSHEPDLSKPMTHYYRNWLRRRYGSEDALQKAWNRPEDSFETAAVPGMEERKTTAGVFRDAAREQPVIDYYRAQHTLVAERVLHYARIVKETWPRPLIVGTFFGYYFSTFGRQAAGCHLEMMRVLESPDIDYVSAPNAYEPEGPALGEPFHSRGLVATVRLHGKLWLDEVDNEPTLPMALLEDRDVLLRNSLANVRRNTLCSGVQGMGLWYFDFGVAGVDLDGFRHDFYGSRGTWDHATVLNEIGTLRRLLGERRSQPYETAADVLFVFDTEAYYYTASLIDADPISRVLEDHVPLSARRSSVCFDAIHVRDLERTDLTPYRVVIFGNVFVLDDAQRELIHSRVAADGRTLVWFYAPGYVYKNRLDLHAVSDLIGVGLRQTSMPDAPQITLSLPEGEFRYIAGSRPFGPLFSVDDPAAEVFGRYTNGEAAVVRKPFGDHTAWYAALPGRIVEPIGHILKSAGAHSYASGGEAVYAGEGLLAMHGATGGERTVVLRNGRSVTFNLPENAAFTLVLDAETGEPLLDP